MKREVHGHGPIPAKIMIVGEAPGAEEEARGLPFIGASGHELDRMLGEAGISRSECYVTNVCRVRPPDYYKAGKRQTNDIKQWISTGKGRPTAKFYPPTEGEWIPQGDRWVKPPIANGIKLLRQEIERVQPRVIIPVGNLSMWALTGRWGISKWRGSMLHWEQRLMGVPAADYNPLLGPKVIPAYHPAYILRDWGERAITVNDLKRAARYRNGEAYPIPEWRFITRPSYATVSAVLDQLLAKLRTGPLRISFDLETRGGHIACVGLSWSAVDAICIPLMCVERAEGYWRADEEAAILLRLYQVLRHVNAQVIGQNLLYDAQYTYRHWHFVPRITQDTMISQHSVFSDLPKGLAYLASMYCNYYVYWKDEGKDWLPGTPEDQLWSYNCLDCVYTYEVSLALEQVVSKLALGAVHQAQQDMFWPVLEAMQRGVKVDLRRRDELINEVQGEIDRRADFLYQVLGHPLNPKSPKQMNKLFYEDFKFRPRIDRKTGSVSTNDEALQSIVREEPLMRPIINCISDIRTMGIFLSNFICAPLDEDQRMRCAYNIGGSSSGKSAPKTYRLSSSTNAFGGGCNLQTIPDAKTKSVGKAKARGGIAGLGDAYNYPNLRSMFVPDTGYSFFNGDLDRADLQVVAWEADDELLKAALRLGADIHLMNVFTLDGKEPPPLDELIERHSKTGHCACTGTCYWSHRGPRNARREFAKSFVHGTDYGGKARTMAAATGWTIAETEKAQAIWFKAHPGILEWQKRTEQQMIRFKMVENKFGYRWYIFDRLDTLLPEALAWIPQSTVSIIINRIWQQMRAIPGVQILLQTHDSLAGQVPSGEVEVLRPLMLNAAKVVVPYADPLIIPFSIGFSAKNWGDC